MRTGTGAGALWGWGAVGLAAMACGGAMVPQAEATHLGVERAVLAVGNSLSMSMFNKVSRIARVSDAGDTLLYGEVLNKGFTLAMHARSSEVARAVAAGYGDAPGRKWDAMVLQEQSHGLAHTLPDINVYTLPAAEALCGLLWEHNPDGECLIMETWGYVCGSECLRTDLASYRDMQDKLVGGAEHLASRLAASRPDPARNVVKVIRAGEVWREAFLMAERQDAPVGPLLGTCTTPCCTPLAPCALPRLVDVRGDALRPKDLWRSDGNHASYGLGSCLNAYATYATLFERELDAHVRGCAKWVSRRDDRAVRKLAKRLRLHDTPPAAPYADQA